MNKSSLEELKQDMEDKRKTAAAYADAAVAAAAAAAAAYEAAASAAAAYTAYAAAYDADAYDVYEAAKKKYEKALEQAPATSSDDNNAELIRDIETCLCDGLSIHGTKGMLLQGQRKLLVRARAALEKDNE